MVFIPPQQVELTLPRLSWALRMNWPKPDPIARAVHADGAKTVFPDWSADPEKEESYNFGPSDKVIQGIVTQSGGHIEVYSEPDHGTTFKIYLPRLEDAVADAGTPKAVPARGDGETVLVVEDHADMREYAATVLENYGYRVIKAENAGEALLLWEGEGKREHIDLVLTDVVMPKMSGRDLATRIEKLQPGIKVVFMSGYTEDAIAHHGILDAGIEFIQKPFRPVQLAAKVREALRRPVAPGSGSEVQGT